MASRAGVAPARLALHSSALASAGAAELMIDRLQRFWRQLPLPPGLRQLVFMGRQFVWRASRIHLAVMYRRYEDREVARVRELIGSVPSAMVVTVIATYRRPEGLLMAVRSALAQTFTDHLVVIVDDGGGLPELPDDPRLVSVALRRNYGCLGMVRNVGIRVTDSEYLAFLDDDNTWTPEHLQVSLEAHRAGADITYTALHRVHPDGSTFDVLSIPFDRTQMWTRNPVDSNALVFRRRPDVRFSRIPKLKEDWALVRRLSRRLNVVHVPVPTVRYLVNPDSYYSDWARHRRRSDSPAASSTPVGTDGEPRLPGC
jgi:glycosyl transferase family 2